MDLLPTVSARFRIFSPYNPLSPRHSDPLAESEVHPISDSADESSVLVASSVIILPRVSMML